MTKINYFTTFMHKKVKTAYRGKTRSVLVYLGIHCFLRSIYAKLVSKITRDIQEHRIANCAVKYYSGDYASWERQRTFEGELPVMERFVDDISDGDVIWDVGANMGTYTCLGESAAENVLAIAFEPVPSNIKRLKKNIAINNSNTVIRNEALDESDGKMGIAAGDGGDGQYSLTSDSDEMQVATVDADSLVESGEVPVPDIIKIDVEGAELRVLRGMEAIINRVDKIYMEVHSSQVADYGGCTDEIETRLTDAGLQHERIHQRGDQYFLRAVRK
jgi:FkbM family methyltransferase